MTQHDPNPATEIEIPHFVPPSKDDMSMGMLCHLLGIFTSFIGPLIIWQIKKEENVYVEAQAREALNFQITAIIATFCCILGFCAAPILIAIVQVGRLTFSIIATVKASEGKLYRYPVTIRFIK